MTERKSSFAGHITAHINNVALHHSIFDLPFAYTGAIMAAGGKPAAATIFWITLAMVCGRSAALALDNLVDLKYDKFHPRFTKRPMVTGVIRRGEAVAFIAVNLLLMIAAVAQLPDICLKLLPLAVLPFLIYPLMKRFSCLCHAVLGVAIAMAPAGGWVAVAGKIELPMIVLCTAVGLWIGSFDVIYGAQDIAFDKSHGLHSIATKFGGAGAFRLAALGHIICLVMFIILGGWLKMNWPYYIGIVIAGMTLVYQHRIVRPNDFSRLTQRYFLRNGIVSMALFIFTWLSYRVG